MKTKIAVRALALLLLSPLVFGAGGKLFTWTPPTERIDATPLPDSEIDSYKIYCDGDANAIWTQTNQPGPDEQWQAPDGTFALGSHSCHATTIDTGGLESDPSNTVNFTVSPERPKAPIFAVQ